LWLIAAQFVRDQRIARNIGIAALTLNVLALWPILMWRVLFDGVVYSNAFDTFVVVCVMMLVLVGFEPPLDILRRYLNTACHEACWTLSYRLTFSTS